MTTPTPAPRAHRLAASAAAFAGAALLGACAGAPPAAQAPQVPASLAAPAGERMAFTYSARGVQIYQCKQVDGAWRWAFVAPEATLYDAGGATVGRHGAGPFWQSSDGSRVLGQVKANAPAPAAGAIPWLLLATRSDGGPGQLAGVTSVQRVRTAGGVMPADGCAGDADVGHEARVAYTADYVFYTR